MKKPFAYLFHDGKEWRVAKHKKNIYDECFIDRMQCIRCPNRSKCILTAEAFPEEFMRVFDENKLYEIHLKEVN